MVEQRGFTIVELIMVIVILGIISAVALPRFFDRKVFDERFYFEEVLSSVRYAQKLAVASGCRIQVSRDVLSGKFLLHGDDNCDREISPPTFTRVVTGPDGQSYSDPAELPSIPSGVTAQSSFSQLVFGPLGCIPASSSDTCATDTLDTRAKVQVGSTFTFTVHSATGFIEVGQ